MKIVYLVTSLSMGGAELQVIRIASKMAKSKSNSVIYVSMIPHTSEQLVKKLSKYNIRYFSLNMVRGKASIKAYIKFINFIKEEQPDVIHSHMVHANLLLRLASPFIRCPMRINTVHGEEEYLGKRSLAYKVTDRFVNYTVFCSNTLLQRALDKKIVTLSRALMIYNGIDINAYNINSDLRKRYRDKYGIRDDCFVWMTVGRLERVKNYTFLLEEFHKVCNESKKIILIFIGDGSERGELEKLAKMKGIEKQVIFLGLQQNVDELLNMADAFVLSSIHEGMPLSLQEAASMRLPLIATNVGGCNEIIQEGVNGFLCESNVDGTIANAMLKLMKFSKEELAQMKSESRNIVEEKFRMDIVMKKWEILYEGKKYSSDM